MGKLSQKIKNTAKYTSQNSTLSFLGELHQKTGQKNRHDRSVYTLKLRFSVTPYAKG